jgi:hypothetical protein
MSIATMLRYALPGSSVQTDGEHNWDADGMRGV